MYPFMSQIQLGNKWYKMPLSTILCSHTKSVDPNHHVFHLFLDNPSSKRWEYEMTLGVIIAPYNNLAIFRPDAISFAQNELCMIRNASTSEREMELMAAAFCIEYKIDPDLITVTIITPYGDHRADFKTLNSDDICEAAEKLKGIYKNYQKLFA